MKISSKWLFHYSVVLSSWAQWLFTITDMEIVAILTKFSSLATPEVASSIASDENSIKMTIFPCLKGTFSTLNSGISPVICYFSCGGPCPHKLEIINGDMIKLNPENLLTLPYISMGWVCAHVFKNFVTRSLYNQLVLDIVIAIFCLTILLSCCVAKVMYIFPQCGYQVDRCHACNTGPCDVGCEA